MSCFVIPVESEWGGCPSVLRTFKTTLRLLVTYQFVYQFGGSLLVLQYPHRAFHDSKTNRAKFSILYMLDWKFRVFGNLQEPSSTPRQLKQQDDKDENKGNDMPTKQNVKVSRPQSGSTTLYGDSSRRGVCR